MVQYYLQILQLGNQSQLERTLQFDNRNQLKQILQLIRITFIHAAIVSYVDFFAGLQQKFQYILIYCFLKLFPIVTKLGCVFKTGTITFHVKNR